MLTRIVHGESDALRPLVNSGVISPGRHQNKCGARVSIGVPISTWTVLLRRLIVRQETDSDQIKQQQTRHQLN